jgi:HSP20 family protein
MAQVPATRNNQAGGMSTRRERPLSRDFATLFDRLWSGWLGPLDEDVGSMRLWDFDVNETDREIIVRAELPGFESNEIDVQLADGVLTIKAEKQQKGDGEEEYRSFVRTITLPSGINAEQAQATYRNGVLELHIPRAEGAQPKKIQIQGPSGLIGQQQQPAPSQQPGTTSSAKSKK